MSTGSQPPARIVESEIAGVLLTSAKTEDILPDPAEGRQYRRGPEPPWIVVSHSLDDLVVGSQWPVRLWEARALEIIDPQGHHGNYTRATAIEITGELPLYTLFGDDDRGVLAIVEAAAALDLPTAEKLSRSIDPEAANRVLRPDHLR